MEHIRKRKEFLAAARGPSQARGSVVVQMRNRGDDDVPRLGLTTTRKLGNAVKRNRIRRRLRAAARVALEARARAGYDYVLIGRASTADVEFSKLVADLGRALDRLQQAEGGEVEAGGTTHPMQLRDNRRAAANGVKP